jgi:hypothetical protein
VSELHQAERVRFCARCGELAGAPAERPGAGRVCAACGMGICLEATRDALGELGRFFLVVTRDLRVAAVSLGAEGIFGAEEALVGTPLELLVSSPAGTRRLLRTVRGAALGVREPATFPVEPLVEGAEEFGPLEARVSPCGSPRAALLAVEPALG